MIGIKGMEMPKGCTEVIEKESNDGWISTSIKRCPLYNVCKEKETVRNNFKPVNCPLVEIITCKECKHNGSIRCKCFMHDGKEYMSFHNPDFYCKDAERKGRNKNGMY